MEVNDKCGCFTLKKKKKAFSFWHFPGMVCGILHSFCTEWPLIPKLPAFEASVVPCIFVSFTISESEDPSWPTAHLWLSARPLTHGDPGLDSNVTIRSVGFIHHLDLQICFILPQKCSPKWIHPSKICVISLFMMAKEGLTREMEGRGGGEINLMLGFNYWVANLISDSLSC